MEFEYIRLFFALIGLAGLGLSFHSNFLPKGVTGAVGWIGIGIFFFLDTPHYIELADPVLILMSGAALPIAIGLGFVELNLQKQGKIDRPLVWLKGATFWSALPYLLISWVPYLSVAVVWFTAVQAVFFLRISGIADLQVGAARVEYADGSTSLFTDFTGNPWLYLEPLGEGGFFIPILTNDGNPAGVSMILACSALQSMIVFVGALVALRKTEWKIRFRGLFIAVPVIHLLNVFRNAGIIYLDMTYRDWNWIGMGMFDFAHSYAAKVGSLFAMFLMAIVIFELVPELHNNILGLMDRVLPKKKSNAS